MTIHEQVPVIPWVLQSGYEAVAGHLLETYFGLGDSGEPYTGAHFETIGRRWDEPMFLDVITSEDLVAVSTLSLNVPASVSIDLLGPAGARVTRLLRDIPADLDLVDADDAILSEESASSRLWTLLRTYDGMGPATTSKLIARKRLRLAPIFDSVVERELGLGGSLGHWAGMRAALRDEDRSLHERARALHSSAGISSVVTPLRVVDIVIWMHGKDHARSDELALSEGLVAPAHHEPIG